MRISIGPGSEYCPTTTGSSCARWKEPSTCGRQSMLSHIRLPYTNTMLSLFYFVHNEEYLRVCLPYHLWIVFGQTPSIPSSRILGGQHPALLSDRSRKPLRLERTSPLTHSGATWGYLYTQLFAQQQVKVLKYCIKYTSLKLPCKLVPK